jgi:hypothetical protein
MIGNEVLNHATLTPPQKLATLEFNGKFVQANYRSLVLLTNMINRIEFTILGSYRPGFLSTRLHLK